MKILADFCIGINVPLKNNIETKDSCKFDKIVREIICENFNRLVNTCIKY